MKLCFLVKKRDVKEKRKNNFLGLLLMSKPGKVLRNLCKKLGVRLTVKRGKRRVYKSVDVLKRQCAIQKKKKVKKKIRRRKFGKKLKKNSVDIINFVKKNKIPLGIGIGGSAALAGGIGINRYLDNLYIKILTLQIPLESVNKNLQKYFNQLFVTQEFFRDSYNTTRDVFFIYTVESNEYNMSGNKRLEQDFKKFDKKIKGKIKKIKEKYKGLNNDIMDQVINYKLYNDYRYFVIQHYKDLGYNSIKTLLEHLRYEIFYSENKYKLKYHLDDLKRLQSNFGV